jgi:hypothetical protein
MSESAAHDEAPEQPRPPAVESMLVGRDPLCMSCGYALRSIEPDRPCPECGHPVASSIDWHARVYGEEGTQLRWTVSMLFAASWVFLLSVPLVFVVVGCLGIAAALVILALAARGCSAAERPSEPLNTQIARVRGLASVGLIVLVGAALGLMLATSQSIRTAAFCIVALGPALSLVLLGGLLRIVNTQSEMLRLPDERLRGVSLLAVLAAFVVASTTTCIFMPRAVGDAPIVACGIVSSVGASMLALIASLIALARLRRAMRVGPHHRRSQSEALS